MLISVVVPVRNGSRTLRRCLAAVAASDHPAYECIVVDDGSTDDSMAVARQFSTRVVGLDGGPHGPAYARNRGAEVARGEILFFVDADVVLRPDALAKVAETFERRPDVAAVFGSYDDTPAAADFLSRYKNLFHHFVHQQGSPEAVTFWSGCGAVRRSAFADVGGFDEERFPRPSIEDIELGYRLKARGYRIVLNRAILATHLKRWTLRDMIKTDVFDRAIPWTQLILRERTLPNALNLAVSQRVSAMLLYVVLLYLSVVAFFHHVVFLPLLAGLFLVVAGNWSDGRPHFQLSRPSRVVAYGLIGAIAALALYLGLPRILVPIGILLLWMVVDQWLPRSSTTQRRVVFGALVLGLLYAVEIVLSGFSLRRAAPLMLALLAIVLINYRFYLFFARKQGLLFMLAVIPFHLFYYFYSVAAFILGIGSHLMGGAVGRGGPTGSGADAGRRPVKPRPLIDAGAELPPRAR